MISESTIMDKLNQYANTTAGKKRMKACIAEFRDNGKTLANGRRIASKQDMEELAASLRTIILKHIPSSIIDAGKTLAADQPISQTGGGYEVRLRFDADALKRNSLWEDGEWEYDGGFYNYVVNIVALLNNGYRAENHVYGYWDNHSAAGDAVGDTRNSIGSSISGSDFAWIRSKKEREALHFMQDAIAEFNSTYSEKYNVTAILGSDYTK